MTIKDSQCYGGSAEEAGWHKWNQKTGETIAIYAVKGKKRRLIWKNTNIPIQKDTKENS